MNGSCYYHVFYTQESARTKPTLGAVERLEVSRRMSQWRTCLYCSQRKVLIRTKKISTVTAVSQDWLDFKTTDVRTNRHQHNWASSVTLSFAAKLSLREYSKSISVCSWIHKTARNKRRFTGHMTTRLKYKPWKVTLSKLEQSPLQNSFGVESFV